MRRLLDQQRNCGSVVVFSLFSFSFLLSTFASLVFFVFVRLTATGPADLWGWVELYLTKLLLNSGQFFGVFNCTSE